MKPAAKSDRAILATATHRALAQVRYVSPVRPAAADGLVARVYAQLRRDFGMVAPPVALHSPAPATLAAAWVILRETLLVPGKAGRAEKEVVAAAVSAANECPYCVTVHSASARALVRGMVPAEIATDRIDAITDQRLRDMASWARRSGQPGRGLPGPGGSFPEIAGVAVAFHYLNRMVSVFLPESPVPPRAPRKVGGWVVGMLASAMVSSSPTPGNSLELLPGAPLPAEFSWAAGEPRVASALGAAAGAIEEAGARVIPPAVREVVQERLNGWDGRPPGPSRAWAETTVAPLSGAERLAARLALLTALVPYQVMPADINAFRSAVTAADDRLLTLTSWASMAAARRIGSWLCQPPADPAA